MRGLHYHERGQDDLFACVQGMVRVVVLDRRPGETFTEDIGDENPVADLHPGRPRARLRGADGLPLPLPRHRGVRPGRSGRARRLLGGSAREAPLEHDRRRSSRDGTSPLADHRRRRPARPCARRGVPGRAGADARASGTSRCPPPPGLEPDLVLHAAAWTDVDGAEDDPQAAAAVNVGGTANAAELGAPLVYYSSDYVFDGASGRPYVESDGAEPGLGLRPDEAPRRGGGGRARLDRAHLLALRADRPQLRAHDAAARSGARRGRGGRRPARLPDVRRPPRGCDASACSSCRSASTTSPPTATAPGPTSPRRSSRRPGSTAACGGSRRPSSAARRRARRTRCCAARRAHAALPHWREGLRECLARLA